MTRPLTEAELDPKAFYKVAYPIKRKGNSQGDDVNLLMTLEPEYDEVVFVVLGKGAEGKGIFVRVKGFKGNRKNDEPWEIIKYKDLADE